MQVLLGVAGLDHVGEDLVGHLVLLALLLRGGQPQLELLDPRRLLQVFHGAQLLGLVLVSHVDLLAAALAAGLE